MNTDLTTVASLERKLEKVVINGALPLKAAQHDVIANSKSSWGLATPTMVLTRFPSFHQT